jgi:hypothetical protein
MPTVNVPDFNSKDFWRKSRLLLWSLIVTVAILDATNLVKIPEPFVGFTMMTYIVAGWVVVYHFIEKLKK